MMVTVMEGSIDGREHRCIYTSKCLTFGQLVVSCISLLSDGYVYICMSGSKCVDDCIWYFDVWDLRIGLMHGLFDILILVRNYIEFKTWLGT